MEVSFPTRTNPDGVVTTANAAKAFYTYDGADNLIEVDLLAPDLATHQIRRFAYDGLGRLLREDNPENGTTLYGELGEEGYDALGNLLQKRDNANNALINDLRRRRSAEIDSKKNGPVLADNIYDETGGFFGASAGKLTTVQSYSDSGGLQVTQSYYYGGLNGRLSGESTSFVDWTSGGALRTEYTYNSFGLRAGMKYPDEEDSDRSVRDVTTGYRNGFAVLLKDTAPDGGRSRLGYPIQSGRWDLENHASGQRDRCGDSGRAQPAETITMGGAAPGRPVGTLYNSGTYAYDGAGNISQIGPSKYRYDEVNRLVGAVEFDNSHTINLWARAGPTMPSAT